MLYSCRCVGTVAGLGSGARSPPDAINSGSKMSEEVDGPDKINSAPGDSANTEGDSDGSSGPPMSMRGGRGGFR